MLAGPSGLGKTFLLKIIFNEWKRNHPKKNFISINHSNADQISSNECLLSDGIVVDNLCRLVGDEKNRKKITDILEHFISSRKPFVFSANPEDLMKLREIDESFFFKLTSGLNKSLSRPDSLLIKKVVSKKLCYVIDENHVHHFLNRRWENLLELNSVIQKIIWHKKFNELDHLEEKELLSLLKTENSLYFGPDFFLHKVATEYGLSSESILSKSRKKDLIPARFELIGLLYHNLGLSVSEIARYLNRNHSSILHALKKLNS